PARLLGADRLVGAVAPPGVRFRLAAPVLLHRCRPAQGHKTAARRRHVPQEDPLGGGDPEGTARQRQAADRRHPAIRRPHDLRRHQRRRGHGRPAARPGRLRHRRRPRPRRGGGSHPRTVPGGAPAGGAGGTERPGRGQLSTENRPRADEVEFAHNSERQFALLLDFYGIPWEYEPRSFPIAWDKDGQPRQFFTPDFFLPEEDLYIEITTMNQKLVTKKNRKVRLLRELYPDLRCKVLYQRDYIQLVVKYGLEDP